MHRTETIHIHTCDGCGREYRTHSEDLPSGQHFQITDVIGSWLEAYQMFVCSNACLWIALDDWQKKNKILQRENPCASVTPLKSPTGKDSH